MSDSNCCFLSCLQFFFQEPGKVVWYSHLFKNFTHFVVIHTVKGCSVVNELEVDFFWGGGRFPCFFYDPKDVCNLISGSSAFSKFSLYVWNFSIHVLLKPSLEDFEHYLASIWNEHNCTVVWAFFGLPFFETGVKTDLFQSCGHCWVSHIAGILSAAL